MISLEEDVRDTVRWQPGPFPDLRARALDRWSTAREVPIAHRRPWFLLPLPIPATPRTLLGAVTLAGLGIILCLVRWPNSTNSVIPDLQIARRPAPVHAIPAPHRVQPPVTDAPTRRIAASNLAPQGTSSRKGPHFPSPGVHNRSQAPAPPFLVIRDPLIRVNHDPEAIIQPWVPLPQDEQDAIEERVRRAVPVRDDFVRIPFPQIAATSDRQIAEAVESYKREAAIVDARLAHPVTLEQKATALSDLCERLRGDTGIQLAAGSSVADEKVTLLCEKVPLRDVMRQLSRPFGYVWLRSRKEGEEFRYELVQDLRSQLLEEELRNRDRNAALLALDAEIERYRPYLGLSPDEALARARTAAPTEKSLLETLGGIGWGPIHAYFRLSNQDLAALRAGQRLTFSQVPKSGEQPLSAELARGVIQSKRHLQFRPTHEDRPGDFVGGPAGESLPGDLPLTSVPEVRARVSLTISQSELGQFVLGGGSGIFIPDGAGRGEHTWLAAGRSPAVLKPDNQGANAALAGDPALRLLVTVQPLPSCRPIPPVQATAAASTVAGGRTQEPKVSTADVLEALHRASGRPIVADHYTRLYSASELSTRKTPLFTALNRLADTMRLRWSRDGLWLQFRSTSFYDDRTKEVPNRMLARWAAVRQRQGMLTLDDLVEIAQLPNAQLDGEEMAEGARDCVGLAEWDLARNRNLRPHLRFLATFTPDQRRQAVSTEGLPFTRMSLAQQQQFIAYATIDHALSGPFKSLDELAGATLRVDYTQPGWYQWGDPAISWRRWAAADPARPDRWAPLPTVRARTREALWEAVNRLDPQIRDWAGNPRNLPRRKEEPLPVEALVFPTELSLTFIYFPGASTARLVRIIHPNGAVEQLIGK